MPIMLTPEDIQACDDILADYKNIQIQGAGEVGGCGDDDYVVSRKHAQDLIASDPPTPFQIPLGGDVNRSVRDRVFEQASDNGIMPIILSLIRFLSGKSLITTRAAYDVPLTNPETSTLISITGELPHSNGPTEPGVPVEPTESEANYVIMLDKGSMLPMAVAAGPFAGERIFGRTVSTGSTSPDSVTVEFHSAPIGAEPSTAGNPYTWEIGQPTNVNLYYGFRQHLLGLDEAAFRRVLR